MTQSTPAIVILGQGSLATARRVQQVYPAAQIHGLAGRVEGADCSYQEFGATLRALYQQDTPIIDLCAAGIVIRTLAPLLLEKGAEPAVLAVAEDGSAVVPLLGGLGGVNVMAREIAAALQVAAAITTTTTARAGSGSKLWANAGNCTECSWVEHVCRTATTIATTGVIAA